MTSVRRSVGTWVLGADRRDARLLAGNILADGLGTAVFVAGVAFFASSLHGIALSRSAMAMSIGATVGLVGSYPVATLADRLGHRRMLLAMQAALATASTLLVVVTDETAVLWCIAGAFALARVQSPVRGALVPLYLSRDAVVPFKGNVKARSVIVAALGAGVATLLVASGREDLTVAFPAVNSASYLVCLVLTWRLPRSASGGAASERRPRSDRNTQQFRPGYALLACAMTLGVLAVAGSVADLAVPFLLVEQSGKWPPGLLALGTIAVTILGIVIPPALARRVSDVRGAVPAVVLAGAAFALSIVLLTIARGLDGVFVASAVLLTAVALGGLGEICAIVAIWAVQYSVGPDAARGRIIAIFALASGLAMAVGPASVGGLVAADAPGVVVGYLVVVAAAAVAGVRSLRTLAEAAPR